MNINMTLLCDVCDKQIDCRFGMSNREVQPLSFACPVCKSIICVTFGGKSGGIVGASEYLSEQRGLFDGSNPFVDLHLDFPVWFGEYIAGDTPFIIASQKIRESCGDYQQAMGLMAYHNVRLNHLNSLHDKQIDIRNVIKLYRGTNKKLFLKKASQLLGANLGRSLAPEDINAALYKVLTYVYTPFVHAEEVADLSKFFGDFIIGMANNRRLSFDTFINHLKESGFLHSLQRDCLNIYPQIFKAELPLRPALFLDIINGYERSKIAARVSADEFGCYKDLYKDIAEVFGRQLILVTGLNNVFHRENHNSFLKPQHGQPLSSLDAFANKTLNDRFKYLDECWYDIDKEMVDTNVRNAIAHSTAHYDEVSQVITYYPEKEGIRQEKSETMFFLDFMYMILKLFREMHYLHHLIKAIFYYDYLILEKKT